MKILPIKFNHNSIQYLAPTWQEMNQLAFTISQNIKKDQLQFDHIVTLAKGGWPQTRSLADFLDIPQVFSIGVKFYKGINQRYDKPVIYQDVSAKQLKGKKILLFDDVADSGESLIFVKKYLKKLGIKNIKTSTLFYKAKAKLKPDYYGMEVEGWIVFPYEVQETIKMLGSQWLEKGVGIDEIKKHFLQFSFESKWVEEFVDKLTKN